jgi:hypothetical protein
MNRQPPILVEWAVHRIAVDSQANSWINRQGERRIRARRWKGKAGQRPSAVTLRRCGVRKRRRSKPTGEASWEGSERRGWSRRQKGRDGEGDRGAAGSLYPGQAARGRVARSGGAKPEEAAHRHLDYQKICMRMNFPSIPDNSVFPFPMSLDSSWHKPLARQCVTLPRRPSVGRQ